MGLEGLLTELLVATILNSVQFHAVGVGVNEMVLGEQVGNGVESGDTAEHHRDDDHSVGNL